MFLLCSTCFARFERQENSRSLYGITASAGIRCGATPKSKGHGPSVPPFPAFSCEHNQNNYIRLSFQSLPFMTIFPFVRCHLWAIAFSGKVKSPGWNGGTATNRLIEARPFFQKTIKVFSICLDGDTGEELEKFIWFNY